MARNAVRQSPRENGQHMMRTPRLDESGDTVAPLWYTHIRRGQPRATLIVRVPLQRLGLPCQRALEVESVWGLDRLLPDLRDVKQTVWTTVCLCRQKKVSSALQKKTRILKKSLTTSSSAQHNTVRAGRKPNAKRKAIMNLAAGTLVSKRERRR